MKTIISLVICIYLITLSLPVYSHNSGDYDDDNNNNDHDDHYNVKSVYDMIILGGGSAGMAMARRLTEDFNFDVLVIESGTNKTKTNFASPLYLGFPTNTPIDRNPLAQWAHSQEGPALGRRSMQVPLTRTWGGATTINGNAAQIAADVDFATWNISGWSAAEMRPYFNKMMNWLGPDPYNIHGKGGPITMQTFPLNAQMQSIADMTMSIFGLGWNNDSNSGNVEGVSLVARNLAVDPLDPSVAIRQPSVNYIENGYYPRQNLKIIQGRVDRVNIDVRRNRYGEVIERTAQSVQYYDVKKRGQNIIRARKEIIVATGTYTVPVILGQSGIGDCAKLEALGIKCVLNNPEVGKNLRDHLLTSLAFIGPSPTSQAPGSIVTAIYKSNPSLDRPDVQLEYTGFPAGPPGPFGQAYLWTFQLLRHTGVGYIELTDADPAAMPNITFNVLNDINEMLPIVAAMRKVRTVMAAAGFIVPPANTQSGRPYVPASTATDAEYLTYIRNTFFTDFHGTGTAALGKVVSPDCKVMGVKKLRVISNAIIPDPPSCHGLPPLAMVTGERCAPEVLNDHL